ncbi:MAG: porphobilinogen synthase, partial [Bacteroidia bacterium]|nr:porphobilinogen synthase [Bacteroidia bacterium]
MNIRPRRNRKSQSIRELVQETWLTSKDLLYPLFLVEGEKQKIP